MRDAKARPPQRQGLRLPLNQDPAKLRIKRIEAGLDQQALAHRAGCSKAHMSGIEKGHRSASPELLGRFAAVLGCPVIDLINTDTAGETGPSSAGGEGRTASKTAANSTQLHVANPSVNHRPLEAEAS